MKEIYDLVGNPPTNLTDTEITEYFPTVTPEDAQRGFITRYFARQANHPTGFILEISKDDYDRLKLNSVYKLVTMPWRISGAIDDMVNTTIGASVRMVTGAKTANRLALDMAEEEMPGMKDRIRNLLQLFQLG